MMRNLVKRKTTCMVEGNCRDGVVMVVGTKETSIGIIRGMVVDIGGTILGMTKDMTVIFI